MWILGFLIPHAPILVPQVASISGANCGKTFSSLSAIGRSLKETRPDFLLLLDPHARTGYSFTVMHAEKFRGSLAGFGAKTVIAAPGGAGEEGKALSLHINSLFPVSDHSEEMFSLEYSAVVSLVLLELALGYIPPMVLINPLTLSYSQAFDLGRHLRGFSSEKKWALLASGDLSHCLKEGAPGGYHPDGEILDSAIIESLKKSSPDPVFSLSPETVLNAGECGMRSALCLIGLSGGKGIEVLSYEAPFGVGYATALWKAGHSEGEFDEEM